MASCYLPDYLLTCRRQFLNKICWEGAFGSFNKMLEKKCKLTEDWKGSLYCAITLKQDYKARTLDISMPGYIKKQLVKYKHIMRRIQNCPISPEPKKFGAEAQSPLPTDQTHKLTDTKIKQVQKIVGSILYYAQAVDMTVLMALSMITSKQIKGTEWTLEKAYQVLDYLVSHPSATVRFWASDMIMNIHLDASYLSKPNAHRRPVDIFSWEIYQLMGNPSNQWHVLHDVFYSAICRGVSNQNQTGRLVPKLPGRDGI